MTTNTLRRWIALTILGFVGTTVSVHAETPNGIWEGAAKQSNGQVWSMRVAVVNGLYLVDYPSLGCGGHLKRVSSTPGQGVHVLETITFGKRVCLDQVNILLKPDDQGNLHVTGKGQSGTKTSFIGYLTRWTP